MEQIKGRYIVHYKDPRKPDDRHRDYALLTKTHLFEGTCENFVAANALCAFRNDKNQLLLVNYHDIVQLEPIMD